MKKLLYLLILMTFNVLAGKYPVAVSIVAHVGGVNNYFTFSQKIVDIGPATEYIPPVGYYIGITLKDYRGGFATAYLNNGYTVGDGKKDIGTLALEAYTLGQSNVTKLYFDQYVPSSPNCIGYVSSPGPYQDWNNVYSPVCPTVPPPDQWCKITNPEIVLDHGTINLQQAEGSSVSANMSINCTQTASVTFNLITDDKYVYLDEGKSEITVNDKPLKSKIDLPQGNSTVLIKDLLTGVNSAGFHTGSSVLIMSLY